MTEFAALPLIYTHLLQSTGNQFLRPIKTDIQPKAPVGVIVRQCIKGVTQYATRGADQIIVLLDREDRDNCPGELATAVQSGLCEVAGDAVSVVVKDRTFENWLIADIEAVKACRARFRVSNATTRAVQPNKADRADAMRLLSRSVQGGAYDKVPDGKAILAKATILEIGANSRSFRRLLRLTGCPPYEDQSRLPA